LLIELTVLLQFLNLSVDVRSSVLEEVKSFNEGLDNQLSHELVCHLVDHCLGHLVLVSVGVDVLILGEQGLIGDGVP